MTSTPSRPQSMAEKILSRRSSTTVYAGDLAVVEVDQVMIVDSIAQSVIGVLADLEATPKFPERVSFVIDHVAPASTVSVAQAQKEAREYATRTGCRLFDVGRGICHQVLVEEKLARPGWIVLGSDSHSTTYGAVAAFGTGMGATDIALAAASGKTWLKVPESVKVTLSGELRPGVTAKDVALEMIRMLGADGATYQSIEIHAGERFSRGERMTLANLCVEAGAKAGLVVPGGEVLTAYGYDFPEWVYPDEGATYVRAVHIDLNTLNARMSAPSEVDNVHDVSALRGLKVDQVFIGTCTNGRLEDLHAAAEVLRGQRVSPHTRLLVIPASSTVMEDALRDGTLLTLMQAGAILGTPGCGPCMGRHQGVLAPGEVCVSTSNRNFIGRMGAADAQIYLASPAVAAATAVAGRIALPEDVREGAVA
ncbi:3-isopropylmalate dehydratase large subunit [Deinococcus peraridilitoris]|uniref:3-isopropylmalate dehydratase large subunit n=1 Tax=Deinococcus peraridilitoris (strain DSM 19664 / LMG 22246 / CIP 109416 / KR-200) TaxID=937777 RepID=L0A2W6_DEIPD|nr:3-isopropylmalate dehydratase large subunit [Deinococcus peraridilitoris]AFZ68228.1 homoaconitate hydratase family protein/3-isopropylmalate dehydratase, large subunit [Deinococcus peraridilitoris DSM 19664]